MTIIEDRQLVSMLGTLPHHHLDLSKAAFLVVDMQYFDAHPDWGEGKTAKDLGVEHMFTEYYQQLDAVTPKIQELLKAFRGKGVEVIHLTVSEVTNDSRDVAPKQLVRGLISPSNSKEAQPLDELKAEEDEIIIKKSSSGVFPVTNIDRLLRNMEIDTLIFTGTSTGGCVESAIRDALDLGYNIYLITDACASGTQSSQELALWRMGGGPVKMMTTEEMLDLLAQLPANDRLAKSGIQRVQEYLPKPPESMTEDIDPYDLIFPSPIEHEYTKDNTVLVVIDPTKLAVDPSAGIGQKFAGNYPAELTWFYNQSSRVIDNIGAVIARCRAKGLRVLYMRLAGKTLDGEDISKKYKQMGLKFGYNDTKAEWIDRIGPESGDTVFNKPGASIFNGTGLDEYLRNLGVINLLFAGFSFDYGIESSVRSSTDRGYRVLVINDACLASHQRLQDELADMNSGLVRSMTTEQFGSVEINN